MMLTINYEAEKRRTLKGTIHQLNIGGRACSLYLPPDYKSGGLRYPVVYMNGTDELAAILNIVEPHLSKDCRPFLLLNIDSVNWNDDMTPWPAPALTNKSSAFGGYADAYLGTLATVIKPFVDTHYNTKPEPVNTGLVGYSLGGLTALYALYQHTVFGKIGCLSSSFWYENWLGYITSHMLLNTGAKVYISLGTKEKESKNKQMAAVGECTIQTADILKCQLTDEINLKFEWNAGGHFTEIPQRFCRALLWLMN